MGRTLDEVRPHLIGFEDKHYTSPTMMFGALQSLGARYQTETRSAREAAGLGGDLLWPRYGLCRIQWEGPWTEPGAPPKWRYRQTHWIGVACGRNNSVGIFDLNCLNNGTGWVAQASWKEIIVPHLVALYPRANGKWHITHAIEVAWRGGRR